ncbi:MAG: copper resistance protein CopC [Dehalococcoidia bacterium]
MCGALLAVAAVSVALVLPAVASAHANLDRAEPAPDSTVATSPATVRIWFTEPVVASASGIEVYDSTGRRVDHHDSRVDLADPALMTVTIAALTDGTYTVAWRNTSSADGHPLRGTYAFMVGAAGTAPSAPRAVAVSAVPAVDPFVRWAVLGGLLVALGAEVFGLLVLAPVLDLREARGADLDLDRRITGVALAVALAGSLAQLALAARAGPDLAVVLTEGRWGAMWLLRTALLGIAGLAWWRGGGDRRAVLATVALLAASSGTLAFASHAAAVRGLAVTAVGNDLVHTLAAAVWTGGLVALLATALRARALADARRRAVLHALARRFSPIAMIATGALLLTGLYATWLQVAAWAAFATPYGWAVIAKAAAYVLLIVIAAVNLLWVNRRLRAVPGAAPALTVTVAAEVALVFAALLAAGFLTSLEPAREAAGQGGRRAEAISGSLRVAVEVSPGSLGANRIELHVTDRGRPLPDSGNVTLRVQYAGADLGAREVPLTRDASGVYVAEGIVLSLVGPWQFDAGVSSAGSFDRTASVRLPIAAAGVTGIALPAEATALLAAGWQVVVLALLVLVVAEAFWKSTRTGKVANWTGTALVVAGIFMVYGIGHFHQGSPPAVGARVNPIANSEESIAAGRALYTQHCITCHGPGGLGDGPLAAGMNPPPASLPLHMPLHPDGDIYAFIEGGFPGSAMPAFRGGLTEQQIWSVVNYLRTLKAP